jgi:hypothetical protein
MASNHNHTGSGGHGSAGGQGGGSAAQRRAPEWADGLKQLYDSVVEEDLPDSFKDLLDRLDGLEDGGPSPGSNDNGAPAPSGEGPRA